MASFKRSEIGQHNLPVIMTDLMANLNEKMLVRDDFVNVEIKNDTVFNKSTHDLENICMCPLFVAKVEIKCGQEFHIFHDCDNVNSSHEVSVMYG